jgi:ABC-type cobalt transport system substrate-binding protein
VPERRRRLRILLLHVLVVLPTLFGLYFFTLAPRSWKGVDESVVERIAAEHGREVKAPLINTDQGDLLLFVFLLAGVLGGFVAGYSWRALTDRKKDHDRP